jgi:hypothetical protein
VVSGGAAGGVAPLAGGAAVALIVDTSGSMLQPLEGGTRADIAKAALVGLVTDTIPPGTDVSLRAFGTVPDSCDTRLVVPQSPLDPAAMAATIQNLEVVNLVRTPIGASLEAVAQDLGTAPGPKLVVLVTDGEETCGGDPRAAIEALVDSGIDVRVNIVGFALEDEALKAQFEEWARLGNGQYFDAAGAEELGGALVQALQPEFRVLDADGNEVARGVVNGEPVAIPAGTYAVEVLADPPSTVEGVVVEPGAAVAVRLDEEG